MSKFCGGVSSLVVFASMWLAAQSAPLPVFVESFHRARTRVAEESFELRLDPKIATCQIRVKDQSGRDRYQLFCSPQRVGGGDERILSWHVRLADLHHRMYENLLMATIDSMQDHVQVGWLDPSKFARIPVTALRVIKVDGFYCVIQVTDFHFSAPPAPYLDRMAVNVKFTNTNPLAAVAPAGQ